MRIFKPQYRGRDGQVHETQKFYLDFRDHRQIRRRLPADRCRTEKQAERFGEMLEALVVARKYGDRPDQKLADWLHGLPKGTIHKLVDIDLVDSSYIVAAVPLEQHVADFEKWLRQTKARHGFSRSDTYIHNTVTQIRFIVSDCGFCFWGDITKAAVETCLGKLNVASKTFNGYVASIKLFGVWMIENGRAQTSPVAHLKPVRWIKTEQRRALTREEMCALLQTTPLQPVYSGMTGMQRAVLYLLAVETGYRENELRCLTVKSFDFDAATVNLGAEYTKNHMAAEQLVKRSRVEQYRAFLAGRESGEPVFPMPHDNDVLDAFRYDLQAAGISPVDDRGVKVVFHGLRHTFATNLDRSGATDKERHIIGRWSDKGDLSLGTYGHLTVHELRAAVERLPDYPWPAEQTFQQLPEIKKEVA